MRGGGGEKGTLWAACRDVLQGAGHLLPPAAVRPSDGTSRWEDADLEQASEQKAEPGRKSEERD